MKNVFQVMYMEWLMDVRRKQGLLQFLLYGCSLLFVVAFASRSITSQHAWLVLFWLTQLFSVIFVNRRAFHEFQGQGFTVMFFLYHPLEYFFGKFFYYLIVNLLLGLFYTFCYYLWFDFEPARSLSGWGYILSSIHGIHLITFVSTSLTVRSEGKESGLHAWLALPFLIPFLLVVWKLGGLILQGVGKVFGGEYYIMMGSVQGICLAVSVLLFPYLWKP